ncbi:hypothetical protein [Microbulbifer zhoushanensis]|uniref:hypothetical protein n=1 Tax=Microbulbifer TaxID=48073 RepID=UPI001F2CEB19|nr:hypothetical protein [Microbulbifer zhoushanensis]
MTSGVRSSLRWCLSLASKFKRVVFWRTSLIVVLTLVSQIAMILAFFLPLKVVILLGSTGIPRYFPEFLEALGRDVLILGISLSAVIFYVVHLASERLINVVTEGASSQVLSHNKKVVLFQNQDTIARNAYKRVSRVFAGGVFIVLSLTAIAIFYLDMAAVLICYVIAWAVGVNSFAKLSSSFQSHLSDNPQGVTGLFAGVGFFVAFAYLVIDFTFMTPPSVIVAILSVLLCRQLFGRFSAVINDVHRLSSQRLKIDALFFHKKVLLPNRDAKAKGIWSLLNRDTVVEWVNSIISGLVEAWKGCDGVFWHASSSPGIAVLLVKGTEGLDNYLVKFYDKKNNNLAMHESTLLSEFPQGLPAPELVGVDGINDFTCQVYRLPCSELPAKPKDIRSATYALRTSILKVEPPLVLSDRYQRSKALLWQRLHESDIKKISIAVSSENEKEQVNRLINHLPEIKTKLRLLPLTFFNPDMRPVNVGELHQANSEVLVNWGRWSLEPIGVGFGVGQKEIKQVGDALREAASVRRCLEGVDVRVVELAAFLSVLEARCAKHQFNEALEIVAPILERCDSLSMGFSSREAHSEAL